MRTLKNYLLNFQSDQLVLIGPMYDGLIELAEPLVFIDGGSKNYDGIGFIVGDGDSSDCEMHERLNSEKNFSDLAYALSQIPTQYTSVSALGFLGGRKDHELINFGEFFSFLSNRPTAKLSLAADLTLYSAGYLNTNIESGFSLLNSEACQLKISGAVKYPFNGSIDKSYSSHLLSNIGSGEVKIQSDKPFGVYYY